MIGEGVTSAVAGTSWTFAFIGRRASTISRPGGFRGGLADAGILLRALNGIQCEIDVEIGLVQVVRTRSFYVHDGTDGGVAKPWEG